MSKTHKRQNNKKQNHKRIKMRKTIKRNRRGGKDSPNTKNRYENIGRHLEKPFDNVNDAVFYLINYSTNSSTNRELKTYLVNYIINNWDTLKEKTKNELLGTMGRQQVIWSFREHTGGKPGKSTKGDFENVNEALDFILKDYPQIELEQGSTYDPYIDHKDKLRGFIIDYMHDNFENNKFDDLTENQLLSNINNLIANKKKMKKIFEKKGLATNNEASEELYNNLVQAYYLYKHPDFYDKVQGYYGGANKNKKNLTDKEIRMIPDLNEPFISVTQAQYGLTRQFNDIRNTPAMDLLRSFIRTYVGDYWDFRVDSIIQRNLTRAQWQDKISDIVHTQDVLMEYLYGWGWVINHHNEDEDAYEYEELRQAWIDYPQDGGRTLKSRTLKSSQTKRRTLKSSQTKRRTLKSSQTKRRTLKSSQTKKRGGTKSILKKSPNKTSATKKSLSWHPEIRSPRRLGKTRSQTLKKSSKNEL